jgi:D-sedoheptulose 7-phosphate isomerase
VVAALKAARERGGVAIGILGRDGGAALAHCDLAAVVPHRETARIQEVHTLILHFICEAVEREYRK